MILVRIPISFPLWSHSNLENSSCIGVRVEHYHFMLGNWDHSWIEATNKDYTHILSHKRSINYLFFEIFPIHFEIFHIPSTLFLPSRHSSLQNLCTKLARTPR
jgi:hypothetical protein